MGSPAEVLRVKLPSSPTVPVAETPNDADTAEIIDGAATLQGPLAYPKAEILLPVTSKVIARLNAVIGVSVNSFVGIGPTINQFPARFA